jgi:hypothetical protein
MTPRPPRPTAGGAAVVALLALAFAIPRVHAAQFDLIQTKDLRLAYYKPTLGFIAPYTTQCFENSLDFYRRTLPYQPTERVNLFLDDFSDYMNAGVWGSPHSGMMMHIAPSNDVFETGPSNERIFFAMNHEMAHVVTLDQAAPADHFWRTVFHGKVRESEDDPITILYGFATLPRRSAPRWHREGTAVFFETWMSGGLGRAQGPYDEMVFRAMVRDSSRFYDPLGLEAEGTKSDFQVGVNSYLYGTRFMSWLAWEHGPESIVKWVARTPGTRASWRAQFKQVYGTSLEDAWRQWVTFEHGFQHANLDSVRRYPVTPYRDLSPSALGSLSRTYLDPVTRTVYAGFDYPGTVAYLGAIPLDGGPIRRLTDVKGPALYFVTSIAYDPGAGKLYYTTDNNDWRDLASCDIATGHTERLMKDCRIGELVFDRADSSLWGLRHFNGISTLVRLQPPYHDYRRVVSFPYGRDLADLDVSPDGHTLSACVSEISGRQTLRLYDIAALERGDTTSRVLHDFGEAAPANFVFTDDGRYLYGSSYYTGVSNIWRYDLSADSMDIVTNAETGFFRPMPVGHDSLVVLRYTGKGFIPSLVRTAPLTDVSAITFLGHDLVERYPVLKSWRVPSPATVPLDSVITANGPYHPWSHLALDSIYPIIEGYQVYTALGLRANVADPYSIHAFEASASVTTVSHVPASELWHLMVGYRHYNLTARWRLNQASFYDLFGPTRVSRKGTDASLEYDKSLIHDKPRTLDMSASVSARTGLDRLPYFQNVAVPPGFDRVVTPSLLFHGRNVRSSLGWVDPEKGHDWRLAGNVDAVRFDRSTQTAGGEGLVWHGYPHAFGSLDLGFPMPLGHTSLWVRTAAGAATGEPTDPFANFYFGGFRNNWVDHLEPKRYRDLLAFPGVPIDDIGGTDFVKGMLDLNLPPLRFRRGGVLDLYAAWARTSVFAGGIATDFGHPDERRRVANAGIQVDFRLAVLIQQPMTLSFGYAQAFEHEMHARHEWMMSLRILG